MRYLRKFENETSFNAAVMSIDKSWVTLTEDDKKAHFMELKKSAAWVGGGEADCVLGGSEEYASESPVELYKTKELTEIKFPAGATELLSLDSKNLEIVDLSDCDVKAPIIEQVKETVGDDVEVIVPENLNSPLIFTAKGTSSIALTNEGNRKPKLQKSMDGETWEDWDYSQINLADGESVYIKGNNPNGFSRSLSAMSYFVMTGSISCDGNVMYLLGEDITEIPNDYCFVGLFFECTSLTNAPKLPATTLTKGCYREMFYGCTKLTSTPKLPATTLAEACYMYMFKGCTSLTNAPKLPATTLAKGCYNGMFWECKNLTTTGELPATTLADMCYSGMFSTCTNLVEGPSILPATTLTSECYSSMFASCSNLTKAPELPSPQPLVYECYSTMFYNCSKLNYVKVGATSWNGSYTWQWLDGVASTGTFVKPSSLSIPTSIDGIPYGWTVENV